MEKKLIYCSDCGKEVKLPLWRNSYERKNPLCNDCYLKLGKQGLTQEDLEDIR